MDCHFRDLPDFQSTINNKLMANLENDTHIL